MKPAMVALLEVFLAESLMKVTVITCMIHLLSQCSACSSAALATLADSFLWFQVTLACADALQSILLAQLLSGSQR